MHMASDKSAAPNAFIPLDKGLVWDGSGMAALLRLAQILRNEVNFLLSRTPVSAKFLQRVAQAAAGLKHIYFANLRSNKARHRSCRSEIRLRSMPGNIPKALKNARRSRVIQLLASI